MKFFYFEGKDFNISIKGYVVGKNEVEALKSINNSIEVEKFEYVKNIKFKKLNIKEHLQLIKILKTFISTGIDFYRAIKYIRNNKDTSQRIKIALDYIINNIETGVPYKEAINMNIYFDYEFRKSMSRVSDEKELLKVLNRLEKVYANRVKNLSEIKNLLAYPILLFSALISLLLFLQFIILPIFKESFNTDFNFTLSWILTGIILSTFIFVIILLKNRMNFDELLYKIPIIKKIYKKYALLEFIETTSIFIESGDTTYEAFEKSSEIVSSKKLKEDIINILSQIEEGENIVDALKKTDLKELAFSITLSKDISDLKQPLEILEADLNFELNQKMQRLKKLLEPILIMVISIIILEVAYGFYGGIFNTISNLGI
ncbi:hypothetical protein JCM30566_09090 [Marinitoga arctica]